jgi:hypothetical protein
MILRLPARGLEGLRAQNTFIASFPITMSERSDVHAAADDCEMHLAGMLRTGTFGDPQAVVVEPPNLCKFKPRTTSPVTGTTSTKALWRTKMDNAVLDQDCTVQGFPRVYTEHADGSGGPSNPRHVFEIHPATRITCGQTDLDFVPFFPSFPSLRHIAASSAHTCTTGLRVWVRYHNENNEDQHEFFQDRPSTCGNFAIVEVSSLPPEWIQATGGRHTAIGRVTANGSTTIKLKLYGVAGTPTDNWFVRVKRGQQQLTDPKLVHAILSYDFFAMVRAIGEANGVLNKPVSWTEIKFPLALVILGPTETVPWEQQ